MTRVRLSLLSRRQLSASSPAARPGRPVPLGFLGGLLCGVLFATLSGPLLSAFTGSGLPLGVSHVSQALGAPMPDGGGQAKLGRPVVGRPLHVRWSTAMPTPSAQEKQAEQATIARERQLKPPPIGAVHHMTAAEAAALRRTAGPPLPSPKVATNMSPHADSDFVPELVSSIPSAGICPTDCSTYDELEPSVANDGKVIMMVGNTFAATSSDNGTTWGFLDPIEFEHVAAGGVYCCDQQVLYEPSRSTIFWSIESFAGLGSSANEVTLFTANGADLTKWCIYSFPPTSFGLPSGSIQDRLDIEYSANFLYATFDAFDSSGNWLGTNVARMPLSLMTTAACSSVTPQVISRADNFEFALGQGATDTMYWYSNFYVGSGPTNGNHVRVFFWPERSTSYTFLDEAIDPFNVIYPGTANCGSQDGVVTNWCNDLNSARGTLYRSRAGYRGFGAPMLGMAWTAGPTNGIGLGLFPYVVRYYFLLSNMSYKGHDNVYGNGYAVAWPSLAAPTTRGYVGGTFSWGGGTGSGSNAVDFFPGNLYLIEDPDAPTQPWATSFNYGGGNPTSCQCWGDYNKARPWAPDGLHWIGAGWWITTFGMIQPYVEVWGRGRDHNAYLRWANS